MADAVVNKTLYDGPNYAIVSCTNISDGTGESAVTKVDPATLAGAPGELVLERIVYAASGMAVKILNDASTATLLFVVPTNTAGEVVFRHPAPMASDPGPGLLNNAGAGKSGKVLFTTVGAGATASYAITMWFRKRTP
jgi:hypothetical protein